MTKKSQHFLSLGNVHAYLSDRIVRIFFAVFRRTAKNLSDMHDLYLTWTLESIQDFDLMLYKKYSFFITLNRAANNWAYIQKIMAL